jgi:DNA-binding MarR family transcriptional regulator
MSMDMTQDMKSQRPIGYWLKQADNLLTEQINEAHATHRVSRADWQVLNTLKYGASASREQIFETMQIFVDASNFNDIMTSLAARGWILQQQGSKPGADAFQLTEDGERQHAILLAAQKGVRQRAMEGISEAEYVTVIRVLQQIVNNLSGKRAA